MKKICLIFVIFALFVFAGCGSSKNKENKTNPDAEESVTDEDTDTTDTEPADTASDDPDSGSGDSGDTGDPDSGDTNSDTGDTNDPEEPDISDSVDDTDSYYDDSTLDDTDSYYDDSDTDETCAENYSWTGKECLPECAKGSKTPCYDSESGLIWSEKASSTMTWSNAKSHCTGLNTSNYGGFSRGWHLPTIDELKTLLTSASGGTPRSANCAVSETNNCLTNSCWTCSTCTEQGTQKSDGAGCSSWGTNYDDGRFSKLGDADWIWSSSVQSDHSTIAWDVSFDCGGVTSGPIDYKDNVRCVRKADYEPPEEELACIAAGGTFNETENSCTKTIPCNPIPTTIEHAEWNGTDTYVSTYDFATGTWTETPTEHRTEGACKFKCINSYIWNGTECVNLTECSKTSGTPCYDSSSHLTWSKMSSSYMTWNTATTFCQGNEMNGYGGFTDWRLPTIDELKTLLTSASGGTPRSANCAVSATNNCLAFDSCWTCSTCTEQGTQKSEGTSCSSWGSSYSDGRFSKLGDGADVYLWSSSVLSDDSSSAWRVVFGYGYVSFHGIGYSSKVRCVRNTD